MNNTIIEAPVIAEAVTSRDSLIRNAVGRPEGHPDSADVDLRRFAGILSANRDDYVLPRDEMTYDVLENGVATIGGHKLPAMPVTPYAEKQLCRTLSNGLASYAEHLRQNRDYGFLTEAVNRELLREDSGRSMVRTITLPERPQVARAFVSDRYKVIDDPIVFGTAIRTMEQHAGNYLALGGATTDIRTYAKFVSRTPFFKRGRRKLYSGFMAANSEVGAGSFRVSAFILDGYCLNGCIFGKKDIASVAYRHQGAQVSTDIVGLISDSRIKQTELLSMASLVEDAVNLAVGAHHNEELGQLVEQAYSRDVKAADMVPMLEALNTTARLGLSKPDLKQIPQHIEDTSDDRNAFGLQAAISRYAQTKGSFERRKEIEEAAAAVLTTDSRQWDMACAALS